MENTALNKTIIENIKRPEGLMGDEIGLVEGKVNNVFIQKRS